MPQTAPAATPAATLADQLGEIRAELARLKAREAWLLAQRQADPVPLRPGWPIRRCPVLDGDQNRKYRCANGNSFAGSQVSNTPSARTS